LNNNKEGHVNMDVVVEDIFEPSEQDIKSIAHQLRRYNTEKIGEYHAQDFAVNISVDDVFIGGGYAIIKLGWMCIDLLWVEPNYRKKGYGSLLLNHLEQVAQQQYNISRAKLNTGNFQGALKFYEHHGYSVFSQLEVFPENSNSTQKCIDYYLKKNLS
tara:strand:+ start:409 stop:882 length:474 start_codon:yes stop_codon:yes gene_type:complete